MRLSEAPEQGSLFEPAELAFRFRETELTIEDALCLLESRGQATEVEGLWTFPLSFLDLNKKVLGSVPPEVDECHDSIRMSAPRSE